MNICYCFGELLRMHQIFTFHWTVGIGFAAYCWDNWDKKLGGESLLLSENKSKEQMQILKGISGND